MDCPNCTLPLQADSAEGISIDVCGNCGGAWLDHGKLSTITDRELGVVSPAILAEVLSNQGAGIPEEEYERIRVCPTCKENLRKVNYSYSSGIIIDYCGEEHGMWLDPGELFKIRAFVQHSKDLTKKAAKKPLDPVIRKVARRARELKPDNIFVPEHEDTVRPWVGAVLGAPIGVVIVGFFPELWSWQFGALAGLVLGSIDGFIRRTWRHGVVRAVYGALFVPLFMFLTGDIELYILSGFLRGALVGAGLGALYAYSRQYLEWIIDRT